MRTGKHCRIWRAERGKGRMGNPALKGEAGKKGLTHVTPREMTERALPETRRDGSHTEEAFGPLEFCREDVWRSRPWDPCRGFHSEGRLGRAEASRHRGLRG